MESRHTVELTTDAEIRKAYPVMNQLRPIGEDAFLRLIEQMQEESNYRLFALCGKGGDEIQALAGVSIQTNLYHGTHAWVHDLVVDEPHRSKGYGGTLLSWVASWADDRDCSCVELASGLWRDDAHRFYEREGMEKYSVTFKKDLTAASPY